jgi:MerR family mercuric resistance operon transcriptional regulator
MKRMTIGMLAATAGIKVTTIRYYERVGLLPLPERTAGRQRNYTTDHLRQLRFIRQAREFEFSIEEVRTLLVLAEPARTSCREVQYLAAAHLKKLRQKINHLLKLEAVLSGAVENCSGEPAQPCPVLELLKSID